MTESQPMGNDLCLMVSCSEAAGSTNQAQCRQTSPGVFIQDPNDENQLLLPNTNVDLSDLFNRSLALSSTSSATASTARSMSPPNSSAYHASLQRDEQPQPSTRRSNLHTSTFVTNESSSTLPTTFDASTTRPFSAPPTTATFMDRQYYPSAHYVPNQAAEPYMDDGYSAMAVLRHEEERAVNDRLRMESQRFSDLAGMNGAMSRDCGLAWDNLLGSRREQGADVEMG